MKEANNAAIWQAYFNCVGALGSETKRWSTVEHDVGKIQKNPPLLGSEQVSFMFMMFM